MWGMDEFLYQCDVNGYWMTEESVAKAMYASTAFLLTYQKLAYNMHESGRRLYYVRPKMHYFAHIAWTVASSKRNPRYEHCFADEDFLGKVRKIACSTHGSTTSLRTLQRYKIFLSTRWFGHRDKKPTPSVLASCVGDL